MNSIINCSRFVAAALGVVLLVGCDSIKDVRDQPFTPLPADKGLIAGTVIGLSTTRPVSLRYDGQPDCKVKDPDDQTLLVPTDCKFYGYGNNSESTFSFGGFDAGTAYNITVAKQPLGKICTVANGVGTVGTLGAAPIVVTCTDDPAVTRYSVAVTTGALASLPGAKVTLTTEDGVQEMDASGQATVIFPAAIFSSGTNLPLYTYSLTATFTSLLAGKTTTNYCTFTPVTTGASTLNFGGSNLNSSDDIVVPTGDVAATVSGCTFPVNVTVAYNGTPAVTGVPPGAMQLGLVNHFTREVEQTLDVNWAYSISAVHAFPTQVAANERSQYELVVTQQPTGQHCVVSGAVTARSKLITATGANLTGPTGSLAMFVDPRVLEWWTSGNRIVRCRAIPAVASQLRGTYRRDRPAQTAAELEAGTIPPRAGEFLTFFEDGTFLYSNNWSGVTTCPVQALTPPPSNFPVCDSSSTTAPRNAGEHGPSTAAPLGNVFAATGVVHGFYAYDPVAHTIQFTAFTASAIFPNNFGLNGMPGYVTSSAAGTVGAGAIVGTVTASNVAKSGSPGHISLTFTGNRPVPWAGGTALAGPQTDKWEMTEPASIPGELTGSWVTADHLRMFTFDKGPVEYVHGGVNGLPTLQAACFFVDDDSTQSGGMFIRRSGQTGNCTPSGSAGNTRDVPHWAIVGASTMPRVPPAYNGRFPGSVAVFDSRPTSPVIFSVALGNPDVLTVQATLFGTPIDQPVVWTRDSVN